MGRADGWCVMRATQRSKGNRGQATEPVDPCASANLTSEPLADPFAGMIMGDDSPGVPPS